MNHLFRNIGISLLMLGTVVIAEASYAVANVQVIYNATTDKLSITAHKQSLRDVLRSVSFHSGVEVLLDPAAEKSVTIEIKNKPIERAFKSVVRNTSYVFYYEAVAGKKKILAGVKVLPSGKTDESALQPVISSVADTYFMRRRLNDMHTGPVSTAVIRQQARYRNLPDDEREKVDAFMEKWDKMAEERKKRQAELNKPDTSQEPETVNMEARRDEIVKEQSPEFYARREQRRQEILLDIIERNAQQAQ